MSQLLDASRMVSTRPYPRLSYRFRTSGLRQSATLAALLAWALSLPAFAHQNDNDEFLAHLRHDLIAPPAASRPRTHLDELLDSSRVLSRLFTALAPKPVHAADDGDPGEVGQWSGVMSWPLVAVHAALLPDGRVLAYDSVGDQATETYSNHNFTRATVWDPGSNSHQDVRLNTGYNIFCSGLALLPDGRAYIAGGNLNDLLDGLNKTHVFDTYSNQWTRGPNMSQGGRWYPSVTPLANGEMLITGGGPMTPEIRGTDGSLRPLTNANSSYWSLYPWMHAAPNGQVAYFGPDSTLRYLNTDGQGSWSTYGQRDNIHRTYGSFAAYDIGKVLVAGGGGATTSARVVDIGSLQVTGTADMNFRRRQLNLTVLADGSVLATGGNNNGAELVALSAGVYAAERWDPATGSWTVLSRMQKTRQYHSIALLLRDGRVLSAGGGVCDTCTAQGYIYNDAEIFSPPYLFKKDGSGEAAVRPRVNLAPELTGYGRSIQITSPDATDVRKVALVRTSAVTHSVNFTQRFIPLNFGAERGLLRATTPANANIAPPGYYMLFVVNAQGTPSIGRFVRLDPNAPADNQPPDITAIQNQSSVIGGEVNLTIRAQDPESENLSYAAEGLPPGLSIGEQNGVVSGTPTTAGSYTVNLTVSDARGGIAYGSFVWLISEATAQPDIGTGLVYEYYEGFWPKFPTFDTRLAPTSQGIVKRVALAPNPRADQFVLRHRGKLRVPTDGRYTLSLKSTNIGRLWIDGVLVVRSRNGGVEREKSGSIDLTAGDHDFVTAYRSLSAPATLRATIEGPDLPKRTIPRAWLLQPGLDLAFEYYEGSWDGLPNFDGLFPVKSGFTSLFDLSVRQRNNDFGVRYKGTLHIGRTGKYKFVLRSSGLAELRIDDDRTVRVNANGEVKERSSAPLRLAVGDHPVVLLYKQAAGTPLLDLRYLGPDTPLRPIGAELLHAQ